MILIVEDDRFYSQRISEILLDHGIASTQVSTSDEALGIDLEKYEGAIVDVMLPYDPEASSLTQEETRGGFATGIAVARRLLQKKPTIHVILLSSDIAGSESKEWAAERSVPFVRKSDGSEGLLQALNASGLLGAKRSPLAFIVHGHDEVALLELKNYIQNVLKWQEPTVLREQPSSGKTLIEKFEDFSRPVDCVFVLMTPDDVSRSASSNDEKRRSRQNVIFELGFFYSSLGRRSGRVLALHKGPIELPTDISGIIWIDISHGINAAGEEIRKEIAALIGD